MRALAITVTACLMLATPRMVEGGKGERQGGMSLAVGTVRYNRVEGLFVSAAGGWQEAGARGMRVSGELGAGLANGKARHEGGLAYGGTLGGNASWRSGVRHYDLTDTRDGWRAWEWENSLSALLAGRDFRDYFERRGTAIFVRLAGDPGGFAIEEERFAVCEWRRDHYSPLSGATHANLVQRRFPPNPRIEEKDRESVFAEGAFRWGSASESVSLRGEGEGSGGNLRPAWLRLELQARHALHKNLRSSWRLVLGEGRGRLPREWRHYLGGTDALRGCAFKSLSGEQMLLVGGYLLDGGDLMHRIPLPLLSHAQLWLNLEGARMWRRLGEGTPEGWVASAAAGIGDLAGLVRLEVARRVTTSRSPFRVYIRLCREP